LHEINEPPAHHAMNGHNRTLLYDLLERQALGIIELGLRAGRLAVNQAFRPLGVEPCVFRKDGTVASLIGGQRFR
jgi:hypothetical protein